MISFFALHCIANNPSSPNTKLSYQQNIDSLWHFIHTYQQATNYKYIDNVLADKEQFAKGKKDVRFIAGCFWMYSFDCDVKQRKPNLLFTKKYKPFVDNLQRYWEEMPASAVKREIQPWYYLSCAVYTHKIKKDYNVSNQFEYKAYLIFRQNKDTLGLVATAIIKSRNLRVDKNFEASEQQNIIASRLQKKEDNKRQWESLNIFAIRVAYFSKQYDSVVNMFKRLDFDEETLNLYLLGYLIVSHYKQGDTVTSKRLFQKYKEKSYDNNGRITNRFLDVSQIKIVIIPFKEEAYFYKLCDDLIENSYNNYHSKRYSVKSRNITNVSYAWVLSNNKRYKKAKSILKRVNPDTLKVKLRYIYYEYLETVANIALHEQDIQRVYDALTEYHTNYELAQRNSAIVTRKKYADFVKESEELMYLDYTNKMKIDRQSDRLLYFSIFGLLGVVFIAFLVFFAINVNRKRKKIAQINGELEEKTRIIIETKAEQIKQEKMNSSNRLIARVMHELNTPLGAIEATIDSKIKKHQEFIENIPAISTLKKFNLDKEIASIISLAIVPKKLPSRRKKREWKNQILAFFKNENIEENEIILDQIINWGIASSIAEYKNLLKNEQVEKIFEAIEPIIFQLNGDKNIELATKGYGQLIQFFQKYNTINHAFQSREINIAQSIKDVAFHYSVSFDLNLDPSLYCMGLASDFEMLWKIIFDNASDAMGKNGTIAVHMSTKEATLFVRISDTGPGIPYDILDKVFEPFFTTKGKGERLGLGLDLADKLVKRHQGTIQIISSKEGACFEVSLPIISPT